MHASVLAWVGRTLTQADITGRAVLEVGSYDVNGSVRPVVEGLDPSAYLGVDQAPGPRVDEVVPAEQLPARFGEDSWDVVISCEMLEHAEPWRDALMAMAVVLRPGGLLVLTTRSSGFPRHEFPDDHWRFSPNAMRAALVAIGCASNQLVGDPQAKHPGVFIRARKGDPWRPDRVRLAAVQAEPAPA